MMSYVELMIEERDKLNRAIEALQGPAKRRPSKAALVNGSLDDGGSFTSITTAPRKHGRTFSAAQRAAQADRMRKMWAKRRRQAKAA